MRLEPGSPRSEGEYGIHAAVMAIYSKVVYVALVEKVAYIGADDIWERMTGGGCRGRWDGVAMV